MNILKISTIIFFFLILSGLTNHIQAQPEFATVRLVTLWNRYSVLFITIGAGELVEIDLTQKYTDRKKTSEYGSDNIIINTEFENLYVKGFKLLSTSSSDKPSDHPGGAGSNASREVIFLFVKE